MGYGHMLRFQCGERAFDDVKAPAGRTLNSMTYDEWESTASPSLRRDPTWKVEAYRLGLYATALAWTDAERFMRDPRGTEVIGQLLRAAGSIAATLTEGYGRRSPKERVRYYEYALS